MTFARRHRKVRHALDPDLVPNSLQVVTLVDLDFIGDHPRTEGLVIGILQVPPSLVFLDETSKGLLVNSFCQRLLVVYQPHLQVLDGITVLIFRRALPSDDVGALG